MNLCRFIFHSQMCLTRPFRVLVLCIHQFQLALCHSLYIFRTRVTFCRIWRWTRILCTVLWETESKQFNITLDHACKYLLSFSFKGGLIFLILFTHRDWKIYIFQINRYILSANVVLICSSKINTSALQLQSEPLS